MTGQTFLRGAVAAIGAVCLVITALAQHPNTAFDRARRLDPVGVFIPNWRFFAPHPAMHDFHVLHRTLDRHGTTSAWADTTEIAPRRILQAVWFPGRRAEKAVFDVASELVQSLRLEHDRLVKLPAHVALVAMVRARIAADHDPRDIDGFQFLVARNAGIAADAEPEYLYTSAFIPMERPR